MSVDFEVLVTDDFASWYQEELDDIDADEVYRAVGLLEAYGVNLRHPHSSRIKGSRYPLRELRVQSKGRPLRILYAFNPERNALLILGGDKTGNDRWYEIHVPIAEKLWEEHLEEIAK